MPDLPSGTVTFLFSDIEGSSRAWDRAAGEMAAALTRHDELLRAAVTAHRGVVVKSTGDGIMAVFADASAAVAAAVAAQHAVADEAWPTPEPLRVRMGIHTGTAEERAGDYFGVTPTRAARIMDAGHGGQILVSAATAGLLAPDVVLVDLGEHPLKGLEQPEHLHQLVVAGLPQVFPPLRTAREERHNLPQERNRFVGRDHEVAAVRKLLGSSRLVTLTGIGGCGKTRLALEVARQEVDRFPDGAFFVDLTTVSDEEQIPSSVLVALAAPAEAATGRSPNDALVAYVARQCVLLVLDNCEHLIDGCAEIVDALLGACPDVTVLATSRESLELEGERAYRVPSLAVPDDDDLAQAGDAVRLFVERAEAVLPGFDVGGDQIRTVVEICRRLDGIPLAIELAAARVSHLSVEEIAERLDDRFRLLTGRQRRRVQRQQTLEATLDWSWGLLSDDERTLLRRSAVFPGRFGLEAVEGICGFGPATVDLLASLVDKSLVVRVEQDGIPGYRLLETMRLYAQQRLVDAEEAVEIRSRHCEWFAAWTRALVSPTELGPAAAARAAGHEVDNLRAAMEWALEADHLDAATDLLRILTSAVNRLMTLRANTAEVNGWAEAIVRRHRELPVPLAAEIVTRAATISMLYGRFDEMHERASLAIELADGDFAGVTPMAFALRGLRYIFDDPDTADGARENLERAVQLASSPDQRSSRLMITTLLAGLELVAGNVDRAIATYESVVEAYGDQEWDVVAWTAWAELSLAYLVSGSPDGVRKSLELERSPDDSAWEASNYIGTSSSLLASIRLDGSGVPPPRLIKATRDQLRFDVPLGALVLLDAWVELALARGEIERAAEILGCQRQLAIQKGWRSPAQLPLYRSQVARVRAELDPERARAARDRGGGWTAEQVLQQELERADLS